MDKEVEYILDEIKILSENDLSHGNRIDQVGVFFLTGLSVLVSASIVAAASITNSELLAVAIGFAALGEFALGAFAFIRLIHLRFRRIEYKANFFFLRRLLFKHGIKSALHLSMEGPKNDIHFTGRNGIILFGINITSSLGLGISVSAFLWSAIQIISSLAIVSGCIAFLVSAVVFIIIQHKYAKKAQACVSSKDDIVEEIAAQHSVHPTGGIRRAKRK